MINASNEVFPKTTEWKKVNIDLELNKEDSVVISTAQLIRLVSRPFDQKSQRKNCSKLWLKSNNESAKIFLLFRWSFCIALFLSNLDLTTAVYNG